MFCLGGMVKKGLVSGVAGLAGVVRASQASSDNQYKLDNQCGLAASPNSIPPQLFKSWNGSGM